MKVEIQPSVFVEVSHFEYSETNRALTMYHFCTFSAMMDDYTFWFGLDCCLSPFVIHSPAARKTMNTATILKQQTDTKTNKMTISLNNND